MVLPVAAIAGISAIPAVAGGAISFLNSRKKTAQEKAYKANMDQIREYNNMLTNPNDPRYKAMVDAETQSIRGGFLANLQDLIEANRRQALLGRTEIFDPERRDESMFSAVNRASKEAQVQARSNVLDRINSAIQNLQGLSGNQLNLLNLELNRRNQQNQNISSGLAAVGTGINNYLTGQYKLK